MIVKYFSTQKFTIALLVVLLAGLFALLLLDSRHDPDAQKAQQAETERATLDKMFKAKADHDTYQTYFQAMAKEKGGQYAFEVLQTAPLPFGLDTHLLGHAVGDILYEQEGVDGMKYCTHHFRNACSHTIVIGTLLEFGTDIKDRIREACKQAPGGTGAYTMCYHGLGHGVLAFNEYDMEKTAEMCSLFGTPEHNDQESSQCFGGAVMEIIGGGGHDRDIWEVQRKKQLLTEDPLSVCHKDYLTLGQKQFCYVYITPFLLETVGADRGSPEPSSFSEVFKICDGVSRNEQELRSECFGGLGKEFIGFVAGRDFRDGIKLSTQNYVSMQDWCQLALVPDGIASCQSSIVGSLYWGGENDIDYALSFCAESTPELRDNCYTSLLDNVERYVFDESYRKNACVLFPSDYVESCKGKLNVDVTPA